MRGLTPWHIEQPEPVFDLLCAIIERAEKDAAGVGMSDVYPEGRPVVQAEAKRFLRMIRGEIVSKNEARVWYDGDGEPGRYVTPAERVQLEQERKEKIERNVAEINAKIDKRQKAEREAERAKYEAFRQQQAEAHEAELERKARATWQGTEAEFAAAWPEMKRQMLITESLGEQSAMQKQACAAVRAAL